MILDGRDFSVKKQSDMFFYKNSIILKSERIEFGERVERLIEKSILIHHEIMECTKHY